MEKIVRKFLLISLLTLSACDNFAEDRDSVMAQASADADQTATNIEENGTNVATRIRDNVKMTTARIRKWTIEPLPPKPPPHAVAVSYCYHAQTDTLCYRQPVAGWENRLIAFQGTYAAVPPPAVTEQIAKRIPDPSVLPENKVASARPVFTSVPIPPKEEEKNPDQPAILDANHEQLPSTNSPQL